MPSNMNRSDHDATTDLPTYRKWPRRLLILLVGLGLFVYFLPSLIGLGPIRQRVLDWALADLNGQAQVESVSLGWFSPIELRNLELVDKAGKRVAQVDQIATSQRLIDFLTSDKLGRIDIVKPVIHLVLTREGSNLESLLAPYLQSETDTDSTTLPPLEVSITDGTLQLDGPSQKKNRTVRRHPGHSQNKQFSRAHPMPIFHANTRYSFRCGPTICRLFDRFRTKQPARIDIRHSSHIKTIPPRIDCTFGKPLAQTSKATGVCVG